MTPLLLVAAPACTCKKQEPRLTAAECATINSHLVDLAMTEVLAERAPIEHRAVAIDDLKKELAKDPRVMNLTEGCAGNYPRWAYDCMMQAATTSAAVACTHDQN
jgi:hypothetical protein